MFKRLCSFLLTILAAATPAAFAAEAKEPLLVFAAASLTDALQKVSDDYTKATGNQVKLSFAASSALARQIESGAKADVFFSADQEWMDYLGQRKLIATNTRTNVLGNKLVLIAPADSKTTVKLAPNVPLLKALGDSGRLSTGDPDSVPVGKYAKAALTSLNVWDAVQPRLVRADNVRVALMYVARGEAPLGIVYATDAAVEPKVRVVDTFPASSHPPISYPVAATSVAQSGVKAYIEFLRGTSARATFEKAGFSVLAPGTASGMAAKSDEKVAECSDFRFDVSRELALMNGKLETINAPKTGATATIAEGRAYQVKLSPQSEVTFAAKPEKPTMAEGSSAGVLSFTAVKDGNLRVSLSEAAWIDVLTDAKPLTSTSHSGSHNCKALRKAVQFDVKKSQRITLQLSGSTTPTVNLLVTQ